MSKTVEKKTWPKYFEKILSGEKNFELRLADFDIEKGDTLVLKEWDPNTQEYTGRQIEKTANLVVKTKGDWHNFTPEQIEQYGWQVITFK